MVNLTCRKISAKLATVELEVNNAKIDLGTFNKSEIFNLMLNFSHAKDDLDELYYKLEH